MNITGDEGILITTAYVAFKCQFIFVAPQMLDYFEKSKEGCRKSHLLLQMLLICFIKATHRDVYNN